jgi:hypothetical protein
VSEPAAPDPRDEAIAALSARLDMEAGLRASQDRDLADVTTRLRILTEMQQATHHAVEALALSVTALTDRQDRVESALRDVVGKQSEIIALLRRLAGESP